MTKFFVSLDTIGFIDLPDNIDPDDSDAVDKFVNSSEWDSSDYTIVDITDYEVQETED